MLFHISGNDFSILQQNDIWQGLESQFVQSFVFQHLSVANGWRSDGISLDVLFAVVFAGVQAESHQLESSVGFLLASLEFSLKFLTVIVE